MANGIIGKIKKGSKKIVKLLVKKTSKRYIKNGNVSISKLLKDINLLKGLVNVEKKVYNFIPSAPNSVAQVLDAGNGYMCEDITPVLTQGVGEGQRIGNSIKVYSSFFKINFRNSGAQTAPVDLKWFLIKTKGNATSVNNMMNEVFLPNTYLNAYNPSLPNILDTTSSFNSKSKMDYEIVRYGKVHIPGDTTTGMNQQKQITIKMKYKNYHLKYADNASSNPTSGQMFLCILANRGNSGPVSSTISGLVQGDPNTGMTVDRNYTYYLIDN